MSRENEAIVTRWFEEVWNDRCPALIDQVFTDQSVCHCDQAAVWGGEGFRQQMYQPLLEMFPDLRVQIDAMLCCDDEVVVRWSASGTHRGEGPELPPTHRTVALNGITWFHIREGKFERGWQSSNIAEVLRSLAEPVSVG